MLLFFDMRNAIAKYIIPFAINITSVFSNEMQALLILKFIEV
jgi:hypothetical protein